MRYILSGIAGVLVSFSLFLMMTHLIKVEAASIVAPPPSEQLVFTEPEVPKPDEQSPEPPPEPRINIEPRAVDRIIDYVPEDVTVVIDMPRVPVGPRTAGGPPLIDSMPPLLLEPKTRFPPQYPRILQSRGIQGYVLIENTVDENGRVVHVEIIESSHSGFERAVRNSAVRWTYAKSDQARRTHREKVAFVLED